jgi:hypothetical protein
MLVAVYFLDGEPGFLFALVRYLGANHVVLVKAITRYAEDMELWEDFIS